MKSLFEYDVLVNDVFYRCWHILEYIEKHSDIDKLERDAIQATIMDALVFKGLINPEKEFLKLDELAIVDEYDVGCYKYEKNPFVMGIPMYLKEQFRTKILKISGGVPVSWVLAHPPGKTHYCVYDRNTAVSAFFEDFTFYLADYDSPTRLGKRAENRPFVEVVINDELYLVDILTKRIFLSNEFKERFNFVEKDKISKKEFSYEKRKMYAEDTSIVSPNSMYLSMMMEMKGLFEKSPEMAEELYEIELSKTYCPLIWQDYEMFQREYALFGLRK